MNDSFAAIMPCDSDAVQNIDGEATDGQREQEVQSAPPLKSLTVEQINTASEYFESRLIGQPEAAHALTNVLYRQSALLKRLLAHPELTGTVPHDPTVLLFAGGPWGKSLAARLISQALQPFSFAPFTILTPLPQDLEGTMDIDPRVFTVPYSVVLVENIETAWSMNRRFVSNLSQLLEAGAFPYADPETKTYRPLPLGLTTFIFTTSVGDDEIRRELNPNGRLGFLRRPDMPPQVAYESVQRTLQKAIETLPEQMLRHVDETIIFRPLEENDLETIFDVEISFYEHNVFPGKFLDLDLSPDAKATLFDQALLGLDAFGTRTLRRTLQRYIDPIVYRAYVHEDLTEDNLAAKMIQVSRHEGAIQVTVVDRREHSAG
jgi:hypothetical protein